jgi:hypothetical protein
MVYPAEAFDALEQMSGKSLASTSLPYLRLEDGPQCS